MQKEKSKFAEMRKKSHDLIMNTALELFSQNGYQATTIDLIAKTAGISKGLLYNYFESKEKLLEAILIQGFDYFTDIIRLNQEEQTAGQKLTNLMHNFVQSLQANMSFWKLYQNIITQQSIASKLAGFNQFYQEQFFPLVMGIFLEIYQDRLSSQEIELEVLLFGSIMDGVAFDYTVMPEMYPLQTICDRVIKLFM
ncbi:MAG TPA: TetR/AcrR family transcriptional regulator [Candidatus Cloacimonadota bacterium]|nr:TetR/AcrR family transcriptional regulator [Candidatus Cloacimonadota bacterium]